MSQQGRGLAGDEQDPRCRQIVQTTPAQRFSVEDDARTMRVPHVGDRQGDGAAQAFEPVLAPTLPGFRGLGQRRRMPRGIWRGPRVPSLGSRDCRGSRRWRGRGQAPRVLRPHAAFRSWIDLGNRKAGGGEDVCAEGWSFAPCEPQQRGNPLPRNHASVSRRKISNKALATRLVAHWRCLGSTRAFCVPTPLPESPLPGLPPWVIPRTSPWRTKCGGE